MTRLPHTGVFAFLLLLLMSWHTSAIAQSIMALEVTPSSSQSDAAEFSLSDLDAMTQVTFNTTTLWTDGEVTFSGVSLKALLETFEVNGTAVEMIALNDYKVVMPLTDLEDFAPIIATRMNGETMAVRDKGPYWVVFPYDLDPKYQTETIYAFSIWQLSRLKVVD